MIYGAGKLHPLLKDAAKAIMHKLEGDSEGIRLREQEEFYRHGQTKIKPESKKPTPGPSRAQSEILSVDMLNSRTANPTQDRRITPTQTEKK